MKTFVLPAIAITLLLILGCQPKPAEPVAAPSAEAAPSPIPEPVPEQAAPVPEQAAAPAEPAVAEPVPPAATGPVGIQKAREYAPPAAKEMTGIVYELLSTAPGRTAGTIRPDSESRKYPFTSTLALKRFDKVRFKITVYNEIYDVQRATEDEAQLSGQPTAGYQGQTVYQEGGNTIIVGVVQEIRSSKPGVISQYTGKVRPLDSFTDYPFTVGERFEKGDQVKLVLDKDRRTVSMARR